MSNPTRNQFGAHWCEEHSLWECTRNRKQSRGGGRCHGRAIRGLDACRMHVGKGAELAKWQGKAAATAATYGVPREVAPDAALLEELHRTAGHVAWLASVVAELDRDDVVWGVVEETERPATYNEHGEQTGGGTEVKRKATPNAWVALYQKEREHLARVAKAAIDAGVSERVVQVYEQIAASYVQVLERVLDELELTPGQRERVPAVVQAQLQAIAGGAA